LTARRGETTVIIGGSGAGKTTLLRLIVGLEEPTSGHIRIDGEDIAGMKEKEKNRVRKKCGMVYQYAALLDSITVFENIAFPLIEHTSLSRKEIRERVMDKLEVLGLDKSAAEKFPSQLSGGMRKRVGLARALMLEPPILIYDEPTSGLDPLTSRLVDDLIDEMRQRFNVTSIIISHDIASCFRVAHQAILLIKGKIVARGTPDELARGDSDVARDFIARSGVDVDGVTRVGEKG
jgi:phospholipid/cholesterol/gamma-HCH transport system ATP-binding protein